jgi:Leucine-rich repeat (LRR) protein
MDLSYNNFSAIPSDIRQFVAIRMLNFSGNPIDKLSEGDLVQPMLQVKNFLNLKYFKIEWNKL